MIVLKTQIVSSQMATTRMMRTIIGGTCIAPKYVFFQPVKRGTWKKFQPESWVGKDVKVMFICPLTLEIPKNGNGEFCSYSLTLQKDWVKKYGPALILSLRVLNIAFALGRAAGVPLPTISNLSKDLKKGAEENISNLTSVYDTLKEDTDLKDEIDCIESTISSLIPTKGVERALDMPNVSLESTTPATSASYSEIANIAKNFKPSDPSFERSGLVLATDMDGVSEYVSKIMKPVYEEFGYDESMKMTQDDLNIKRQELKVKHEKEKHDFEALYKDKAIAKEISVKEQIVLEGVLEKKGHDFLSGFKEKYFVLYVDGMLVYYKSEEEKKKNKTDKITHLGKITDIVKDANKKKPNDLQFSS